ncbi:MAG TPA: TIGR02996 domain-containing protein [Fimbriiglobus sp.]|jgi:uncharacterized protein (TIGR02996 family)|nr:TIGR02996 domain-containing protein [Fimbriiglobus sp.]
MTADERALIQAIIAAPDDDLPRLVYADWLEEHGRPERAEFIRVQCELAQPHPCGCDHESFQTSFLTRESIHTCFDRVDSLNDMRRNEYNLKHNRDFLEDVRRTGCRLCKSRIDDVAALRRRERELLGEYPDVSGVRSYLHAAMPVIGGDGWRLLSETENRIHHVRNPKAIVFRGFVAWVMAPLDVLFGPDGCAAALFKSMPIQRVRLMDRAPEEWQWSWRLGDGRNPRFREELPEKLFDRLPGQPDRIFNRVFKSYHTCAAAMKAETVACLALGRALANGESP